MLQGKNIAVFIDVDNCGLEAEHFNNVIEQVSAAGEIVSGKIYGANERKHKAIIAEAEAKGFDSAFAMRVKKRNSKVFDNRIIVDVVETVLTNNNLDAVAIVCAPSDLVYFYRQLKKYGIAIMAVDNSDDETNALIDEVIDLGKVEVLKLPKKRPAPIRKKVEEPVAAQAVAQPQPEQEPEPVAEPQIAEVDDVVRAVAESQTKATPAVAEQPVAEQKGETISYQQDDSDIIKKIEQLRSNSQDEDTELVDQIRKLLEDMKK